MLALGDVIKLIPPLLVGFRYLAVIQADAETNQPLLAKIERAVHVVVTEDATFNQPSGFARGDDRSGHRAKALGKTKIHERGSLNGVNRITKHPNVRQTGIEIERWTHLISQRVSNIRRP